MIKVIRILLLLALSNALISRSSFSQNEQLIDSLLNVIRTATVDNIKIKALNKISWQLSFDEPEKALEYAQQALALSKKTSYQRGAASSYNRIAWAHYINNEDEKALEYNLKALDMWQNIAESSEKKLSEAGLKGLSSTLNNIGLVYEAMSDYSMALSYNEKAVEINTLIGNDYKLARNFNNMGVIYHHQGDFPRALEYYLKSLKIKESTLRQALDSGDATIILKAKRGITTSYNNIGGIYQGQGDFDGALEYYLKSLKIDEEIGHRRGMAFVYNNIGNTYKRKSDYFQALEYYSKCLKIHRALGEKRGMSKVCNNTGSTYMLLFINNIIPEGFSREALLDSALKYEEYALSINRDLDDEYNMTFSLKGIGDVYRLLGNFETSPINRAHWEKAVNYYKESAVIAEKINALERLNSVSKKLAETYAALGDYQSAHDWYNRYTATKDSLFNEEKSKEIGKLEAKHEFETAEIERKRLEEARRAASAIAERRRNNLQYSGILIFIVLLFAGLFALGKFSIPVRVAEGMIFFSFLLFFEFTLVMLDPYIEEYSAGAPAIKLAFNAVLAALIFPLHSLFENKLKRRLAM